MQHCVFEFQFASFVGVMCIFVFKYPGGCYRVFFILGGGGEFTHKKTDLTYLDFRNIVDLWDLSGIGFWDDFLRNLQHFGVGMDFDTNMKMSVLNLSNLSYHVRFLLFDLKL